MERQFTKIILVILKYIKDQDKKQLFIIPYNNFKDKDIKDSEFDELYSLLEKEVNSFRIFEGQSDVIEGRVTIEFEVLRSDLIAYHESLKKVILKRKLKKAYYDERECIFHFNNEIIDFSEIKPPAEIFKILWKNRRIYKEDKVFKKIGDRIRPSFFSGILKELGESKTNVSKERAYIKSLISNLRAKLKEIEAPVEIDGKGGYLLIIQE